jgi:UDP-3-O-[3-hydroxymyristoyl] glucosamine N-acyltransferase
MFGDSTIVRKGVKLDNLIQIAHNVEIGKNTVIAAQAGISGSSAIGWRTIVPLGGQVGIAGHLVIANNTGIGAQSGISKSIKEEGQRIIRISPAFDIGEYFPLLRSVQKTYLILNLRLRDLEKRK